MKLPFALLCCAALALYSHIANAHADTSAELRLALEPGGKLSLQLDLGPHQGGHLMDKTTLQSLPAYFRFVVDQKSCTVRDSVTAASNGQYHWSYSCVAQGSTLRIDYGLSKALRLNVVTQVRIETPSGLFVDTLSMTRNKLEIPISSKPIGTDNIEQNGRLALDSRTLWQGIGACAALIVVVSGLWWRRRRRSASQG